MGPVSAFRSFFGRALDFNGRSRRSEYGWMLIIHTLANVLFGVILIAAGVDEFGLVTGDVPPLVEILGWIIILIQLALFFPWTALAVRRFHDMGQTGWLVALFYGLWIIPPIGALGGLAQFFWLVFGSGNAGNNSHGPDPRFSAAGAFG